MKKKFTILILMLFVTSSIMAQYYFTNQQKATYVIGQPDFTARNLSYSSPYFGYARQIRIDNAHGKMYKIEGNVIFRLNYPITANFPAWEQRIDITLDYASQTAIQGVGKVIVDPNGNFWLTDGGSHRIVRWSSPWSSNSFVADVVLGQSSFSGRSSGSALNQMYYPYGMCFDAAGNLWVADGGNNRILRFNAGNQTTGATANGWLANTGGGDIAFIGTSLFITGTNRVLRYDDAATKANGAGPDAVLGQPDLVTTTAGTSQTKMSGPGSITQDASGNLYVKDGYRILIFNNAVSLPNGAPADVVLGQPNFTTAYGGVTNQDMIFTGGEVVYDDVNNVLLAADNDNYRVLVFAAKNTAPTAPVANAAAAVASTQFTANWNVNTTAQKYFLDVATDAGFGAMVAGYSDLA